MGTFKQKLQRKKTIVFKFWVRFQRFSILFLHQQPFNFKQGFLTPSIMFFSFQSHPSKINIGVAISICNEVEGVGTGPCADWLAWVWKASYLLLPHTTSDVMLFAVKALTGCTLNILAICPIIFCFPKLKPFKDWTECHFRADWLTSAHIWNTWF